MRYPLLFLALGFLLLCSCSSRIERNPSHSFRTFIENGVEVAETSGGPKYSDDLFLYTPILEIKPDTSISESFLSYPNAFYRGSDGRYYIPDGSECRVAVFNSEGVYERSIGRRGNGPGEFQRPWVSHFYHDNLVFQDESLVRTTVFHIDGRLDQIYSLREKGHYSALYPAQGKMLIADVVVSDYSLPMTNLEKRQAIIVDADGDTVAVCETDLVPVGYVIRQQGRGSRPMAYAPNPLVRYIPDQGILLSTGEQPVLNLYGLEGSLKRQVRLNIEPEDITPQDWQEARDVIDRMLERAATAFAHEFTMDERKNLQLPEQKAFWTDVQVDNKGYSWLLKPIPWWNQFSSRAVMRYRVLNSEGEYLGDTTWPVQIGRVQDGYLFGISIDPETDERTPTIFRIDSLPRGLEYP